MVKKLLLPVLLFIQAITLTAQDYEVVAFQGEYNEITEYNSLVLNIGGPFWVWSFRFDLDFEFPYFDSVYHSIIAEDGGYFGFEPGTDLMRLFGIPTEFDEDLDIFDIQSDIRYKLTEENGLRCLVLQYTNVQFIGDPSVEEHDSHLNYQVWFFEDGTIEIRFGNMNLDHSPGYSPGEGFFLIFNNGNLLIPIIVNIGITSPDYERSYFISGLHNDFEVTTYNDTLDRGIRDLPPEGWVIRFSPRPSSTTNNFRNNLSIYPNPVKDILTIAIEEGIEEGPESIEIVDAMGRTVLFENMVANQIDIGHLPPGMYVANIRYQDKIIPKQIIKK